FHKLLQITDVNDLPGFPAVNLLDGEGVPNVNCRQVGAGALRGRKDERAALEAIELVQVKVQFKACVVCLGETATHSANGIAGQVSHESQGRGNAVVLEPGAKAQPVAEQVIDGENDEVASKVA